MPIERFCAVRVTVEDPAEAESLGVLLAAARAGEHGQESTMAGPALVVVAAKRAADDGVSLGRRQARACHA